MLIPFVYKYINIIIMCCKGVVFYFGIKISTRKYFIQYAGRSMELLKKVLYYQIKNKIETSRNRNIQIKIPNTLSSSCLSSFFTVTIKNSNYFKIILLLFIKFLLIFHQKKIFFKNSTVNYFCYFFLLLLFPNNYKLRQLQQSNCSAA